MSRTLAVALWAVMMVAMFLFMNWGQRFKRQFEGFGVEMSRSQMLLITLSDILVNYWYIPSAMLLILCLAFSGVRRNRPQPDGE